MGDLNAQIAACTVGARRLARAGRSVTARRCSSDDFEELLDRSETMTREALRAIPEGTYRYVDYLDNDGDRSRPAGAHRSRGDRSRRRDPFDFTGTEPQVRGPLNCVPSGSLAAACFAVRALTDARSRRTAAASGRSSCTCRRARWSNPEEPAPVNARTSTIKRIAGIIVGAFAEAMPDGAGGLGRGTARASRSADGTRTGAHSSSAN